MMKRTALATAILFSLTGCIDSLGGKSQPAPVTEEKAAEASAPKKDKLPEYVVARVNGSDIQSAPGMKNLDDVIVMEVLAQEARSGGLTKEQVDQVKAAVSHIERQMLTEAYLAKVSETLEVTKEESKAYYQKWVDSQDVAEYRFRFARFDDGEKARETIEAIKSGENADLSEFKYLKSAETNKDRVWSSASDLPPMFASILPGLVEKGTHDKPLPSNQGYFVIYLEEKREKELPSYEDVAVEINQAIKQEEVAKIIQDKRSESVIQIK